MGRASALAGETRRRGLPLAGHAPSRISVAEAAESGLRSIEHGESLTRALDSTEAATPRAAQLARVARAGAMITPTLLADYTWVLTHDSAMSAALADTLGRRDPRRRSLSPQLARFWEFSFLTRNRGDTTDYAAFFRRSADDLRTAHRAGVPFLAGTDLGVVLVYPGSGVHEEMALLVARLGLTPLEALQTATRNPPAFFAGRGEAGETGTIVVGKQADLVLLEADPLADIRNTRRIAAVVTGGRFRDRNALDALLGQVEAAVHAAGTSCAMAPAAAAR